MSLTSGDDFVFKKVLIAVMQCLCSQVKLYLYFSKCGLLSWQDNCAVSTRVSAKVTSRLSTYLSNPILELAVIQ